jgi:hypothetical protein
LEGTSLRAAVVDRGFQSIGALWASAGSGGDGRPIMRHNPSTARVAKLVAAADLNSAVP